ncbi:hypothetical protein, partial [Pseudomonas aeruginosa]
RISRSNSRAASSASSTPSLEDLYRHHMSPAPAGATPCP